MRNPFVVVVVGLVAAGLVLASVVAALPEAARSDLLVEVAKAAIGLFPVTFFSVLVADLVRRRDSDKAHRAQRLEAKQAFRLRSIEAYNRSKAVRRTLRAAGLRPDAGVTLGPESLAVLDEQLRELVIVQLAMEQLKREALGPGAPFAHAGELAVHLETLERYLNRVIKEWEAGRPGLTAGAEAGVLGAWAHFADFVAPKGAPRLDTNPKPAFDALENAFMRELDELT